MRIMAYYTYVQIHCIVLWVLSEKIKETSTVCTTIHVINQSGFPSVLFSFTAPEVLGPEHYDMSCDMWSIGVIAYIL